MTSKKSTLYTDDTVKPEKKNKLKGGANLEINHEYIDELLYKNDI